MSRSSRKRLKAQQSGKSTSKSSPGQAVPTLPAGGQTNKSAPHGLQIDHECTSKLSIEPSLERFIKISTVTSWLVSWLSVEANGIFNFFSDPAFQLWPFSISLCLMVLWMTCKLIHTFKIRWIAIPGLLVVVGIVAGSSGLVKSKREERELEAAKQRQDRSIITSLSQKNLSATVMSAVGVSLEKLLPSVITRVSIPDDLPGCSFNMLVRLGKPVPGRDNYLFDLGEDLEHNRMSLYIDSQQDLCFRVIDQNSHPIVASVKPALETFNFGAFCYLKCEYGSTNGGAVVRLSINGTQRAEFPTAVPIVMSQVAPLRFVVGASLSKNQNCAFDSKFFVGYGKTLSRSRELSLLNWANDVANVIPAIPFTGENLLESENPIRLGLIRSSESDELFKYGMALIPKF